LKISPFLLCVTFSVCLRAQMAVPLGSDVTYTVLAGSTVTNTGPTTINGNLGVSPGTAVTGFPPGSVAGGGAIHAADGSAGQAQTDLTTAYVNAMGQAATMTVAGDIGGQTLTSGVYKSTSTLGITGTLTLSGPGFFIFQVAAALTTASGSKVVLIGGAQAANVFWQVGSSATLGTTSIFVGTILAQASVTLTTGAVLDGRALARTGAVTLDDNTAVDPGPEATGGTPPALSVTCPNAAAPVGIAYSSSLVATGGTPPYTYSITGSLPPGLILDPATGAITGTPTGGVASFTAKVTDSTPATATNTCLITNSATGLEDVPTLSTWALGLLALLLVGYAVGFRRKARV
jgi:ice-binding like protein/putative Ig domain-containing protein/exosortase sorting signal-containing protein